jgi:hypothetical protein
MVGCNALGKNNFPFFQPLNSLRSDSGDFKSQRYFCPVLKEQL